MTLSRQKQRIVEASVAISLDRPTDQEKAFLARHLVQTTLPHANPGNVPVWSRRNGNLTLTIQQGYDEQGCPYGHPYGTIPRLLLYWMTTEALRTKSPKLDLGDNLADFMEALGLDPSRGGKRSDAHRLKDQMLRLFEARISFKSQIERDGITGEAKDRMQIAEQTMLWWDHGDSKTRGLWNSYVVLDPRFYKAITASPVPVDLRVLQAIRRSPLALDLYSLLTYQSYRAHKMGQPRFMSWKQLQTALGTSYERVDNLRAAVKSALAKIEAVYPSLLVGEREGGIEVLPESLPSIDTLKR